MNTDSSKNEVLSDFPTSRHTVDDLLTTVAEATVPGCLEMMIDMEWADDFLERCKRNGCTVTITAILLKAIAIAQRNHPDSRSERLPMGGLVTYEDIVAGFTVEREVDGQLAVFFGEITSPETKPVEEIARELKACGSAPVERNASFTQQIWFSKLPLVLRRVILKYGRMIPSIRLQGQRATFGLTSLGKYGVQTILCPCICTSTFGVGAIQDSVVVRGDRVVSRHTLEITFNYDQRVINHSQALNFFADVCKLMEGGLRQWIDSEIETIKPDSGDTDLRLSA